MAVVITSAASASPQKCRDASFHTSSGTASDRSLSLVSAPASASAARSASTYELTFVLDGDQLRAETHAAFPGLLGRCYRAAVVGSGGHRIIVRRLLRRISRALPR